MKRAKLELATRLVHVGERMAAPRGRPTATPVYTSATYLYPSAAELEQAFTSPDEFVYSRYGNPTLAQLEAALASAEGGTGALACGSGMAALYVAVLAAGSPRGSTQPSVSAVLASRDLYGATTALLEDFFAAQRVAVRYVDMCDLGAVDAAIGESAPSVLLVEQISNPLLRVVDVAALAERAHACGARLVVDNTIPTPILERPLELGADVVVHSATKFIGGHADATAGVVVARTTLVHDLMRRFNKLLGALLGPFEASLVARGLKTLDLRVRAQCRNALHIARWLEGQPAVSAVHYPGLESHPQHALARERFGGLYGALVSFELAGGTREAAFRFIDALELVLPATSLGDVYTLVTSPLVSSHRDLSPEQRAARGIRDGLVRLSVGIEDPSDLEADLERALSAVER